MKKNLGIILSIIIGLVGGYAIINTFMIEFYSDKNEFNYESIEKKELSSQSNYRNLLEIPLTKEDSLIEKLDDSLSIIKDDYDKLLKIKQKKDSIIELNSKLENMKN